MTDELQKLCDEKLHTDEIIGSHRIKTREYFVLDALLAEERFAQGELGEKLGIDRTSMVKIADKLELRKLIERTKNPDDRRSVTLTLTELGRTVVDRATNVVKGTEDTFLKSISTGRITQMRELLNLIVEKGSRP